MTCFRTVDSKPGPSEPAGAAVFFASPAARDVHGQVLAVDGGRSAR